MPLLRVSERHRALFGDKRKTRARQMMAADWQGLRVMRDLRFERTDWRAKSLPGCESFVSESVTLGIDFRSLAS
jgi:hypothetical protein